MRPFQKKHFSSKKAAPHGPLAWQTICRFLSRGSIGTRGHGRFAFAWLRRSGRTTCAEPMAVGPSIRLHDLYVPPFPSCPTVVLPLESECHFLPDSHWSCIVVALRLSRPLIEGSGLGKQPMTPLRLEWCNSWCQIYEISMHLCMP